MELGWIVPWHTSSIYRVKYQSTPPFETNMFHKVKVMNQNDNSPGKAIIINSQPEVN